MFRLMKNNSRNVNVAYDFEFKEFKEFYALQHILLMSLTGKYTVNIVTEDVKEIEKFVDEVEKYFYLNVDIHTSSKVIEILSLKKPNLPIENEKRAIDIFKELVELKQILFDKNVLYTLYGSIGHTIEEMETAIEAVHSAYGSNNIVTEMMIAKLFILNKTVYPRQVLLEFLWYSKYRWTKLKQCSQYMSDDVIVGAFIKNLRKLMEEKEVYMRTGAGTNLVKAVSTERLCLLYRIFVVERGKINNMVILLQLYERGVTVDDTINR